MVSLSIIHPADADQRLDRFIKKYLPNAPLWAIYKMLRTGKIKVNGKKKDQTYKLQLEDEINFWLSDDEISNLKSTQTEDHIQHFGKTDAPILDVLYEDEYLMVVNKPAWINVHPGDHKTTESSLIDQVQDYLKWRYDSLTFRPALVHRIDRDTSGCLLIAKDKSVLEFLLQELQSHAMNKVYHAIVCGIPKKLTDTIRARLLRIENAKNEAKVRVDESGQSAITHYKILNTISQPEPLALLECRIETGRTHQIRVHMESIWHPVLMDRAYGNKSINSFSKRQYGIDRQLLHARELSFLHPKLQKTLKITAPYPLDFLRIFPE